MDADGYAVLVPAVDADGNDVAGVRVPMVEAPLGTYVGWNLRTREFGQGAMHQFTGSYLPFPDTDSEAAMTSDPRASVLARYRGAGGYAEAIEAAARRLVDERLMLEEDVERVVARARDWGRPLHDVRLRDAVQPSSGPCLWRAAKHMNATWADAGRWSTTDCQTRKAENEDGTVGSEVEGGTNRLSRMRWVRCAHSWTNSRTGRGSTRRSRASGDKSQRRIVVDAFSSCCKTHMMR